MTTTATRPTTRVQDAPTEVLRARHKAFVRDLTDLRALCDDWDTYRAAGDGVAHEVTLIEKELWGRGVVPPIRPQYRGKVVWRRG